MKKLTILAGLVVVLCSLPLAAHAQIATPGGLPTGPGGYPKGSYRQSCINITYQAPLIWAYCFNNIGSYQKAMNANDKLGINLPKGQSGPFDTSFCAPGADLKNIQGYLQCNTSPGSLGRGGAVPPGSYQMSCYFENMDGFTLSAFCWDYTKGRIDYNSAYENYQGPNLPYVPAPNSGWVTAKIDLSTCDAYGDIENIRGQLRCKPGPNQWSTQPSYVSFHAKPKGAPPTNGPSPQPGTCKPGYTWRQAVPSDHVCVTPATRQQTANDDASARLHINTERVAPQGQGQPCLPGYVWRQAFSTDFACVTPRSRNQAAADNAAWPSRTY